MWKHRLRPSGLGRYRVPPSAWVMLLATFRMRSRKLPMPWPSPSATLTSVSRSRRSAILDEVNSCMIGSRREPDESPSAIYCPTVIIDSVALLPLRVYWLMQNCKLRSLDEILRLSFALTTTQLRRAEARRRDPDEIHFLGGAGIDPISRSAHRPLRRHHHLHRSAKP